MASSSSEFAEDSVLDFLIPEASEVDIEDALSNSEAAREIDDTALITSISQRTLLFFDEKIPVYVVLRARYHNETQLKTHISRLSIILEAHAVSTVTHPVHPGDAHQNASGSQPRDVIWSGKVNVVEDPVIVVEESDDDDGQAVLVIWRLTAFLARPRIRLQAPAIIFKLSASIQPLVHGSRPEWTDPYLPSGVPFPVNLLQPLQDDPALKGATPRLSAQRLLRAAPTVASVRTETLPLKTVSRKAFRAVPALSARMKYHRSNAINSRSIAIALLDIEIPAFAQSVVILEMVRLQLTDGMAEDMVNGRSLKLPIECRPRDNTAFLYRLELNNDFADTILHSTNRALDVTINAVVNLSSICRPRIEMRWRTSVDFSTAVNPNFGRSGQSLQRNNRPASLQTPTGSSTKPVRPSDSANSSAKNSIEGLRGNSSTFSDNGITVTFTAAAEVYVGEPFRWDIFIVNRSNKVRNLVIVVAPRQTRIEARKAGSRPTSSSSNTGSKSSSVADAVLDENLLYTDMKAHRTEEALLACLTTDIRAGPLQPGSCYATEIKFLPLAKGFLRVEAIRIIDATSNETIDVQDLPDIEALERVTEG